MGTARWSPEEWDEYISNTKNKTITELFQNSKIDPYLDPLNIKYRESCDSSKNPNSTPIIVAVDQTGSMGFLAEELIRHGLGVLIEEIYDRKPVSDPHVMCMAVGDAWFDRAPLQVTQFEADTRIVDQLEKFFIEGGGGGNRCESYNLPWYFAANKTKCDSILKRNKKGYLFTVGDEPPPTVLEAGHVKSILGDELQHDLASSDLLNMVSRSWEVFHIMISEGSYFKTSPNETKSSWKKLLGQRAIILSDYKNLAELIVSTIQINEGLDVLKVASSWSGNTSLVVKNALQGLSKTAFGREQNKAITRF